jgi:ABC-type multidrug transport system fused ATPase/permease subunit
MSTSDGTVVLALVMGETPRSCCAGTPDESALEKEDSYPSTLYPSATQPLDEAEENISLATRDASARPAPDHVIIVPSKAEQVALPPAKLNGDRRYDSDVNGDRGVDSEVPEVMPYADPEDVTLKIGYPATIDPDTRPIIQFASGIFYAHEGKNATIPIMRIDNLLGTDTVEYETLPSPFEGKKFIPVKGTIKFLPGESRKKIVVEMLGNDLFESTVDMGLRLYDPSENVDLGLYLWRCRVKIIDDDAFPTNKFAEEVDGGIPECVAEINPWLLMIEFCKFHYTFSPDTWKVIALDQLDNVYLMLTFYVYQYMTDNVFMYYLELDSKDRETVYSDVSLTLVVLALALLLPNVLLHWKSVKIMHLDIASPKHLQLNLLRKYLNYEEKYRIFIKEAEFLTCMTSDVYLVWRDGYWNGLYLIQQVGKLMCMIVYIFVTSYDKPMVLGVAIVPLITFPVVLGVFLRLRMRTIDHYRLTMLDAETDVLAEVDDTVENYRVIADYFKRPLVVAELEEKCTSFRKSTINNRIVEINNGKLPGWISNAVSLGWVLFGGWLVLYPAPDGYPDPGSGISVGSFFAVLGVFQAFGLTWASIYSTGLSIQATFPALQRITEYMNKRTDVHERKKLEDKRLQVVEERRSSTMTLLGADVATAAVSVDHIFESAEMHPDKMPICVIDGTFTYTGSGAREPTGGLHTHHGKRKTMRTHGDNVFENVTFEIEQGQLVAITGKPSSGKRTLLEIFGQVQVPLRGLCFVPTHLRVLHIAPMLYFLEDEEPLRYNLFLGTIDHPNDLNHLKPEDVERACRICQRLSLPEHICSAVGGRVNVEIDALPRSDRALLSLARALISNPEVLVIHTPGIFFGAVRRDLVMHVLHEFVEQRGLCMDPETRLRRRPRTCIFSTEDLSDLKYADQILECQNKKVKPVKLEGVQKQVSRNIQPKLVRSGTTVQDAMALTRNRETRPIIQFAAGIYYACEGSSMSITIMRMDNQSGTDTVQYETLPSALEGIKFRPVRSAVTFAPGQNRKTIDVEVLGNDFFESTVEFGLRLYAPSENVDLGSSLWRCRVKIIDDDSFPTNKFAKQVEGGKPEDVIQINPWFLMIEFCKFFYAFNPDTWKVIVLDGLDNVYYVMVLYIYVSITDDIFLFYLNSNDKAQIYSDVVWKLMMYSIALFLPNVVLHWKSVKIMRLKMAGAKPVQVNLLRKYLNYDERSRALNAKKVPEFIKCMTSDCLEVIKDGYWNVLFLSQQFGKLNCMIAYVFVMNYDNLMVLSVTIVPLIAFPLVLILFLWLRMRTIDHYRLTMLDAETDVQAQVDDIVENYRVIADYSKRILVVGELELKCTSFRTAEINNRIVLINNGKLPGWISSIVSLAWILFGGWLVLKEANVPKSGITVGKFFGVLSVFTSFGSTYTVIYNAGLSIQATFPALQRITEYMNKQTDVQEKKRVEDLRIQFGEKLRGKHQSASSGEGEDEFPEEHPDQVPISVIGLTFGFSGENVFEDVNFEIEQGTLVAVTGKPSQGKQTLLEILGQVQIPPKGLCFVPSHLKVLHIAPTLYFLESSLRYNLFFGIIDSPAHLNDLKPEVVERAEQICQKLLLPEHILGSVRGEVEVELEALPRSERALLSLARALITNPEVLVIHTPGIFFGADRRDLVMRVLHEYVDMRGLCMDPETLLRRDPRTCIFSSSDSVDLKYADQILECKDKKVESVSLEDVKQEVYRADYFRI